MSIADIARWSGWGDRLCNNTGYVSTATTAPTAWTNACLDRGSVAIYGQIFNCNIIFCCMLDMLFVRSFLVQRHATVSTLPASKFIAYIRVSRRLALRSPGVAKRCRCLPPIAKKFSTTSINAAIFITMNNRFGRFSKLLAAIFSILVCKVRPAIVFVKEVYTLPSMEKCRRS